MFKYLTPIPDDSKAAVRRKVSCRDQVLEAVIVDAASSHVTAEASRFALQGALADGQYVHQHLGRLQANSRTSGLEIIDRYALSAGGEDVSVIIVARRVSIADTPWWQVDLSVLPQQWPLVPVQSKNIDVPPVDMTCSPWRPPIESICGTLPFGTRRTFGISSRPSSRRWDRDSFKLLPVSEAGPAAPGPSSAHTP